MGNREWPGQVGTNRKATVSLISISECLSPYRTLTWIGLQQQKFTLGSFVSKEQEAEADVAQAHSNWTGKDWENVAWSDESLFLLRLTDGRVMNPSTQPVLCQRSRLVEVVYWCGGCFVGTLSACSSQPLNHGLNARVFAYCS